jgi:hypothetical protein
LFRYTAVTRQKCGSPSIQSCGAGQTVWAANLVDRRSRGVEQGVSKEYPFIKSVEYARMRGPEENENCFRNAGGIYPYDMVHVGDDLFATESWFPHGTD